MTSGAQPVPIDAALTAGFSYACRPECGLCCYAEPLVAPTEIDGLLRIAPEVRLTRRGPYQFVPSYPDGGACRLLRANRCRAHSARPSPCREFPLTAHIGTRVQVTVVLSCPGVDVSVLRGYGGPERAPPARGFDSELAALRSRVNAGVLRRLETAGRRRRRVERLLSARGRWSGEEEVRRRLRVGLPAPTPDDFPVDGPPSQREGLERLPLFFDGRAGPVALASRPEGWELLELAPTGGVVRTVGVAEPPDRPPSLSGDAARTLTGYLRYWLERDALFGAVHLEMLEDSEGSVADRVAGELRRVAAVTLSRAAVLASVRRGDPGPLSADDVCEGIRATDQDLLDRESWGSRL